MNKQTYLSSFSYDIAREKTSFDVKTMQTLDLSCCDVSLIDLKAKTIETLFLHEFFEANETIAPSDVLVIISDLLRYGVAKIEGDMESDLELHLASVITNDAESWSDNDLVTIKRDGVVLDRDLIEDSAMHEALGI